MGTNNSKLELAALSGDLAKIKVLLNSGYDINYTNSEGSSILHLCCFAGHANCVEYLIKNGAKMDAVDAGLFTPLHRTVQRDHVDCTRILLDYISEKKKDKYLNYRNSTGATPLHWAAIWNAVNCIKLLIQAGADINAQLQNKQTPLHCAALCNSVEALQTLLAFGADPSIKDDNNMTASDLCNSKKAAKIFSVSKPQKDSLQLSRPVWIPDYCRGECFQCGTIFSLSIRRHHCRKCGEIFCNNCTNQRMAIPTMGYNKLVRVCFYCAKQMLDQQVNEMPTHVMNRNSLSYSDSDLSDYRNSDSEENSNIATMGNNA